MAHIQDLDVRACCLGFMGHKFRAYRAGGRGVHVGVGESMLSYS